MNTESEIDSSLASRKKVRTVNPFSVLAETIREASTSSNGLAANVEHGGGVANAYNYPATSECFGAVAVRTWGRGGRAYGSYAAINANKITTSGAANATLGVRSPWDDRMKDTSADYAYLRRQAWEHGDVRWIETSLGGLYYHVPGYGWRNAAAKPTVWRGMMPKRAVRAMRRLCPANWQVVVTPASQGAKPSPAWRETATGETYHIAADGKRRWMVAGSIAAAAQALSTRQRDRDEKALAELIESGKADNVWVCAADSTRAGNCVTGTQSFASRHALDVTRHYTAGELRQISNGDARYVRAAILAALRRERKEVQQGFALLSEHGK